MKKIIYVLGCVALCSCTRTPDQVMNKVMVDFGLKDKPEGYQSRSDVVMNQLRSVGQTEMKRMNMAGRQGAVRFQEDGGLQGKYYKEVKVYETAQPVDARSSSTDTQGDQGFVGFVDYTYRVYQSERTSNRAEAEAKSADIRTDQMGHETYRYKFGAGGNWDGREGELSRR